jgi:rhodanese-related sulfurtransferase
MSTPTETAKGLAARAGDVQIVDVREPDEWVAGHIDGSLHIPLNTLLAGGSSALDASRPAVVVCRSGARSELATLMLQARGFEAANLVGGLEAWMREGLPLATDAGTPGRVV